MIGIANSAGHFPAVAPASTVTYSYDQPSSTNGVGRLTSVSDTSGTTNFFYDSMGRITRTDKTVDSIVYTTQSGYDTLGRIMSIGYPDNTSVSYNYNGPLQYQVYDTTTTYAQYSGYNALGQPTTVTLGSGSSLTTTNYTYSNINNVDCPQQNFRLCKITTTSSSSTFQNVRYSYDNAGNISGVTDALATAGMHTNQTQTFNYDDLNRLKSASGPYGAITYNYDQVGDMLCYSALGSTPTCDPTQQNYAPNYTYGATAHAHAVTSVAGVTNVYDLNGNMSSRGTTNFAYDFENHLNSVNSGATTFVYDGDGGRVKKTSGGSVRIYIGKLFECTAPCYTGGVWTGTKHIFAGSTRIAIKPITTTGDINYIHSDHLGSASVVTDKYAADYSEFVYYPFGDTYTSSGSGVNYKYTGKERDIETSLYFYGARYYDSRIGRFITPDSIVPGSRNPQHFNRYSYTINNPIRNIDPTGHRDGNRVFNFIDAGSGGCVTSSCSSGNYFVGSSSCLISNCWSSNQGGGVRPSSSVVPNSVKISQDGMMTFSIDTSLPVGTTINTRIQSGFLNIDSGLPRNYVNFQDTNNEPFATVNPGGTADFTMSVVGFSGTSAAGRPDLPAYMRIIPEYLTGPPTVVTDFQGKNGYVPCDPCRQDTGSYTQPIDGRPDNIPTTNVTESDAPPSDAP